MSKILSKYSLLLRIFDIRAFFFFILYSRFSFLTEYGFSYYKESQKILGNTYGMCVLQDFEAITPNLLARTIETVEGGGLVVLLLKTMTSLKQLYTMTMVCPRCSPLFSPSNYEQN
jgi:tRNA(Met) C34 N-acetyltransferase TmcA